MEGCGGEDTDTDDERLMGASSFLQGYVQHARHCRNTEVLAGKSHSVGRVWQWWPSASDRATAHPWPSNCTRS